MSALNDALNDAFAVLLGTNGEPVLFRGAVVEAVVNRDPFDRIVKTPDFDVRDASEIRIRIADATDTPRAGEEFQDDYGIIHRIQTVKRLGLFHTCRCKTSDSLFDLLATEDPLLFGTEEGDALQAA